MRASRCCIPLLLSLSYSPSPAGALQVPVPAGLAASARQGGASCPLNARGNFR